MKKYFFLVLIITVIVSTGWAQTPVADPDTIKNPVKQIDPEVKQEPADIHYVDEQTRISIDQLPTAVKDSLKKLEPAAWEKSVIYRDKSKMKYSVEVREGGAEKVYHFNSDGKLLKDQATNKKQ